MTITLDFWQLLSAAGAFFVLFCGFQWWLLKQVAAMSAEYHSITENLKSINSDINVIQEVRQANDLTMKRIDDRLVALENRTMYRMEVLEIMKNLDRWCRQLTAEIQGIVGKELRIDPTDFQTDIIRRQQQMDERIRS